MGDSAGAGALCGVCASAAAAVYCRNDAALLCLKCDTKIHSMNPFAARHWRVQLCELCEREPATIYCRQVRARVHAWACALALRARTRSRRARAHTHTHARASRLLPRAASASAC
jgi:hypothetical protein